MTPLDGLTRPDLVFPRLEATDAREVIAILAREMAAAGVAVEAGELERRLLEREELGSTGIGSGVAIPHCKLPRLDDPVLAVGITRRGIDYGAVDDKPVRIFFVLISPEGTPAEHLRVLADISRWVRSDSNVAAILEQRDRERIYELLGREG